MVKLIESSQFADVPEIGAKFAEFNSPAMSKEAETIFGQSYDSLKPTDDRYVGIHLTALGDEETYGPNRNSDSFPKEACVKYHDTFVKHGHVFWRHHNDAEKDEILGTVKASAYNDKMGRVELFIWADKDKAKAGLDTLEKTGEASFSMACRVPWDECFPKGTLVLTERGYAGIETVSVGDRVMSASGVLQTVEHVMSHPAGRLARVSVLGLPLDIECTPNHPFHVVRASIVRGCSGSVNGKPRRHTFYGDTVCKTCHRDIDMSADWVAAGDMVEGDYIKVQLAAHADVDTVGVSFAYLSGQYVGDGSFVTERRGHDGDGELRVMGLNISASAAQEDAGIVGRVSDAFIRVSGKDMRRYQEANGRGALKLVMYDQLVANRVCALFGAGSRTKFVSAAVESWSDRERAAFLCGLIDADGCITADKHAVRITTVNRGVALSVQRLCWSLGLRATCYVAQAPSSKHGAFCADGPTYGVQFAEFTPDMFAFSDKLSRHPEFSGARPCGSTVLIADGCAYLRVTGVSVFASDSVSVYNMEVAEDHTYNAEGASVHNCSVCGVHRKNNQDPNMCDHIRHGLGKVAENGKVAFMRNVLPDFFDISFVPRPADRIAYSLKVASGEAMTSEMLAKAAGVVEPPWLDACLAADKHQTVRALADQYDVYSRASDASRVFGPVAKAAEARVDDATIDTLRRMPIKEAMAFLIDNGTFLGPDAFCRYAMGPKSAEYVEVGPRAAQVGRLAAQAIKEAAWLGRFDFTGASDFDVDRFTTRPSRRFSEVAAADACVKQASFTSQDVLNDLIVSAGDLQKVADAHIDDARELCFNTIDKPILATALKYAEYKVSTLTAAFNGAAQVGASNTNRDALLALVAAQDL